jgi:hypothetical protein
LFEGTADDPENFKDENVSANVSANAAGPKAGTDCTGNVPAPEAQATNSRESDTTKLAFLEHELAGYIETENGQTTNIHGVLKTRKPEPSGAAERQARFKEKQIEAGLRKISLYVREELVDEVREYVKKANEKAQKKKSSE